MPRDLRQALHEAAPAPRGELNINEASRRGRVLARQRRATVALVSVMAASTLWVGGANLPFTEEGRQALPAGEGKASPGQETSGPETCRARRRVIEARGVYGKMVSEATTPVVEIAAGKNAGRAWTLCAYWATFTRNDEKPKDTLCWEFRIGPGPHSGYACQSSAPANAPPGVDYFLRAADGSNDGEVAFWGALSQRVKRVVLRPEGGTATEAAIFKPEEELGVDYKFFVGFAPQGGTVTITVKDESGKDLEKERFREEY